MGFICMLFAIISFVVNKMELWLDELVIKLTVYRTLISTLLSVVGAKGILYLCPTPSCPMLSFVPFTPVD